MRVSFYNENNELINTVVLNNVGQEKRTIQIPENTTKVYFYAIITSWGTSGGSGYVRINNIELVE